jgi:hypothetical protein
MQIGDIVKVFSSTSEYDGQTGRIVLLASAPGAPAPFLVQFGDAITEPFSERELVSLKPITPLWSVEPLETHHAPHGASTAAQIYIGRIIASKFLRSERRRLLRDDSQARRQTLLVMGPEISRLRTTLAAQGFSPCLRCGALFCEHRYEN